jgi:hypothetical protein
MSNVIQSTLKREGLSADDPLTPALFSLRNRTIVDLADQSPGQVRERLVAPTVMAVAAAMLRELADLLATDPFKAGRRPPKRREHRAVIRASTDVDQASSKP